MNNQNSYKSVTLKSLVLLGLIATISTLKKNENGYSYVTALRNNPDGDRALPNNIYFTKNTAAALDAAGVQEGDSVIGRLAKADVVQTVNNDGEIRFKMYIPTGENNYASKSEMMDIFGAEETIVDFDMDTFVKEFEYTEVELEPQGPVNNSRRNNGSKLG